MRLEDFDFDLPEDRIAVRPVRPRSAARLLVVAEGLRDAHVYDLPDLLQPGDRLVFNDTRVIPARLEGVRHRPTAPGARIDVTLMEPLAQGGWSALARPLKKLSPGDTVHFAAGLTARVTARHADRVDLAFDRDGAAFEAALADAGAMPLPPYIAAKRAPDAQDREDYQTIFARAPGAVAAPTAALHFDAALMDRLAARGIATTAVTLHVGAGTFLPVKVDDVTTHRMHAERGTLSEVAAAELNATRAAGGRIIPVGTTALRLLETAATPEGRFAAWEGATDIFIYPGYRFRAADALMTNFHLPRSTLMMLVSALVGRDVVLEAYAHAVAAGYRFFSYGDASLLIPQRTGPSVG
ncbi:tRNA preQ1(34) S-adenosylmethionine ribosyltransferase-isomerase QueA [Rhodobaculum claviforme]|uniref:S-adenosylmethionine:tRNA ribosyltransferase-isomerase n=1 Tax=Rhodobaculum claviforme TaxID=1549854 RepID=A0A934WJL6_9RHOB|nr:tRNA preQ1(34) S-adenosylmethionine ribosyltransferase-isomerase QueA [Rhodobaculum claviforme]MBK5928067.1 tRNA preQ1(34) S-adenosylmethionine ribosyltransferase-isomerase QueA [Rhodobaculum claviforme]